MKKALLLTLLCGFLTGCAAQIPELTKTSLPDGIMIVRNNVQTTMTTADFISLLGITNGKDGAPGQQGIQGLQGLPGQVGSTGPQGLMGLTGATGAPGIQGIPGVSGASFAIPAGTPDGYIPFAQASAPGGIAWTGAVLQISAVQKKGLTSAGVISTDKARVGGEWISAYLNITSITSGSISIQYQYVDSNGITQTKTMGSLSAKGSQSWVSVMDNTVGSAITTTVIFATGTVAVYDISYQMSDLGK